MSFILNEQKKKHKKSKKEGGEAGDAGEGGGEKKEGKRAQRATSNVFGMFPQTQIQEFKEVRDCFRDFHKSPYKAPSFNKALLCE